MNIAFNNLRLVLASNTDELLKKLNKGVQDGQLEEELANDIERNINNIVQRVITLCCCYEEGNAEFRDLSEEIDIREFNPEKNYDHD